MLYRCSKGGYAASMQRSREPNPARRNERSRQAILAATRELVQEWGYGKVTIEAIAARAGVGKQTIYRWWPSKGAVVFDSVLALSESPEGEGVSLPDTGDLEADLKAVMRATAAEFSEPAFDALIRALTVETMQDEALAALYRERLEAPLNRAKRARLLSAQRSGQLPADADLDLFLEVLYAPFIQRWLARSGPLDDAYADRLVEVVMKAFSVQEPR